MTGTTRLRAGDDKSGGPLPRQLLGQFLRARRESVTPEMVVLPGGLSRRRTPGLRREEVAVLANVGLSWYTWLEQGRDIQVSDAVLDNVAAALLLAEPERAYLYELAGKHAPQSRDTRVERPLGQLQRIVDGYTLCPAYIVDRYWNVVAVNTAGNYIFRINRGTNCLEEFFTDSTIVERYPHQDLTARMMVANFRRQAAKFPDDLRFHEVADNLSQVSSEFEKLWVKHIVDEDEHIDVVYDHEVLGRVTFESTVLQITDTVDLRLFLYFAKPGSRTEQVLAARQPSRMYG